MATDRERAFSKRGASAGVLLVAAALAGLTVVAAGIAALLVLAF